MIYKYFQPFWGCISSFWWCSLKLLFFVKPSLPVISFFYCLCFGVTFIKLLLNPCWWGFMAFFSSKGFIIVGMSFNLRLILFFSILNLIWCRDSNSFSCMKVFICPSDTVDSTIPACVELFWHPCWQSIDINIASYVWTPKSFPFIYLSTFMPVSHHLELFAIFL